MEVFCLVSDLQSFFSSFPEKINHFNQRTIHVEKSVMGSREWVQLPDCQSKCTTEEMKHNTALTKDKCMAFISDFLASIVVRRIYASPFCKRVVLQHFLGLFSSFVTSPAWAENSLLLIIQIKCLEIMNLFALKATLL